MKISEELIKAAEESTDYDSLTALYIQCRDGKEVIKREIAEKNAPIDALMKMLEGKLLKMIEDSKLESVRTAAGTVYKINKSSAKVDDWNCLLAYIKKNDAFDLLTKAVSKEAVRARIDESNEIVPGVSIYSFVEVGVRRA